MLLPKELTTHTKTAKYLAIFVFIVLPFIGFGLGMSYEQWTEANQLTIFKFTNQNKTSVASSSITITEKDYNKTFNVRIGDEIVLFLGDEINWKVSLSNTNVLERVSNLMLKNGVQGIYTATHTGSVTINAAGSVNCQKFEKVCPNGYMQFTAQVVVE